jgi:hypothetical protein
LKDMAATVQVEQITGPTTAMVFSWKGTTDTPKSGTRYKTEDDMDGSATTYPIPIPTEGNGISGSYWVTHCVNVTGAPSTYIKNLRYYQTWTTDPETDWALGANVENAGKIGPDLYIGISSNSVANARLLSQGFPSGSYTRATGVLGEFGYYLSGYAVNGANGAHLFYSGCNNAGSPLSGGMVPIGSFDGVGTAYMVQSGQVVGASTGRSWCIVTQVLVGSGATQGDKADKTATFVYSEV